ncbi:MAG: hypothetical protein EXS14_08240 [Planctomycetes bacterium]|nr:hypothetical protein [Planctomycetota bacterium]
MADDTEKPSGNDGRTGKLLLTVLLVLDALALILLAWLWLSAAPERETQAIACERNLLRLKQLTESLAAQVDRIKTDRLETVSVPSELIAKVAMARQIREHITPGKPITRPWKKENSYEQVVTDVTFLKKMGYPFLDLVSFMQDIEKTNPKVQVSYMNFGQAREDKPGEFMFQPLRMEVRVFNPKAR